MDPERQGNAARDQNKRRALWLVLALAVVMLSAGFYTVPKILRPESTIMLVSNSIPPALGILALFSALLIRQNRFQAAGVLMVAGISTGMLTIVMMVDNLGFVLAAITFVVATYLAGLLFSGPALRWTPVVNFGISALFLLVDVYWPLPREWAALEDLRITYLLGGGLVLVYMVFVLRQFRTYTMRSKLILMSLVIALTPMLTLGFMAAALSRVALEQTASSALAAEAVQAAERLDDYLNAQRNMLQTEAKIPLFHRLLQLSEEERRGSDLVQESAVMLRTLAQKDPASITGYALYDLEGKPVLDTTGGELSANQSGRSAFQSTVETGAATMASLETAHGSTRPGLYIRAPVINESGQVMGVLSARYQVDLLQERLLPMAGRGEVSSNFMVVSQEGLLLADSQDAGARFQFIAPLPAEKLTELREQGFLGLSPDAERVKPMPDLARAIATGEAMSSLYGPLHPPEPGVKISPDEWYELAGVARMQAAPWYVAASQQNAVLNATLQRQLRGTVVVGIFAAVLAMGVAMWIARYLSNPISQLTGAARRIASGDLTARAQAGPEDEVGILAAAFNQMASELAGLVSSLEERVAERTRALATSAEVSRRLSTILDAGILVQEVVEQLRGSFNYYHVHIYLLDDSGSRLVMAGGTGEAGRVMLDRQHALAMGAGLVGKAAETGLTVMVRDVSAAPDWLPNPLLPGTRSELAVPIRMGETVLGVLDVQQDQVDAFQAADAELLESIASQVAIGLRNAHMVAETRRRADREAQISAIGQRIQRALTTEEALQVAAREIGRALQAEIRVRLQPQAASSRETQQGQGRMP
jgi:putative methionine-R-sulfoxide reductase with GAF domain